MHQFTMNVCNCGQMILCRSDNETKFISLLAVFAKPLPKLSIAFVEPELAFHCLYFLLHQWPFAGSFRSPLEIAMVKLPSAGLDVSCHFFQFRCISGVCSHFFMYSPFPPNFQFCLHFMYCRVGRLVASIAFIPPPQTSVVCAAYTSCSKVPCPTALVAPTASCTC